jgi:hypothetical protein
MRHDAKYVNDLPVVMDRSHETKLVPGHVEYRHGIAARDLHEIGMRELKTNVIDVIPTGAPSDSNPMVQRGIRVGMAFGELHQHGPLNDPHTPYIMYGEKQAGKMRIVKFF